MPYLISWIVAVFLLFILFAVAGCGRNAVAADGRMSLADVVTAFDQTILQGQSRVSKWPHDRTLRLKVTTTFSQIENEALENAIEMLARDARLILKRDDRSVDAEIVIERAASLGPAGAGSHNVGRTHSSYLGVSGELQNAIIALIPDWARRDPKLIGRTMAHEMLHAVGFHGHAPSDFDSVMGATISAHGPTDWDLLFLQVLYDPRLPLGTPRVFALPIACRLLHERLVADRSALVRDLAAEGAHPHCQELVGRPVVAATADDRVALAWAYLNGLGIGQDLDEAERWARRSLAAGDADSDYLLHSITRAR